MHKLISKLQLKKTHFLSIVFFLFFWNFNGNAQKNELSIKQVNFDAFPKVKADIWVRDPDGIDTSQLFILEEGIQVKKKYLGKKDSTQVKKNKSILFLVLNPGSSTSTEYIELSWYKQVLSGAINHGTINKGDKIDILNFNHQFNGQILYPSSIDFTDDVNILIQRINSLTNRYSSPQMCSNRGSLVLPAIDRALDLIQSSNVEVPTGIVVLSDDVVCPNNQVEGLTDKAKKRNIPIYSIVFSGYRQPFNSIDAFCIKTFGQYYKDADAWPNAYQSSIQLSGYLTSFLDQHRGIIYKIEWTTTLPKDGLEHDLVLKYRDSNTVEALKTPKRTFLEWCSANPILVGAAALCLLLLVIGGVYYYNYRKKLRLIEEQKFIDLKRKQEEESVQLSSKLQSQKSELDQLKRREQAEKELQEENKRREIKAERDKEFMQLMKMSAVSPSFDCIAHGSSFIYPINKPELVVGRGIDCELYLNYPTVSKRHCKVSFTGTSFVLQDLGSSNGTTVNNKTIQRITLKHGDVVRLGEVILNFRM
jgi:hypothetical protein